MGPCLFMLGCQGTAREVTHPGSPRGTRAGLGEEPRGPGHYPHGPSSSPFLNLDSPA